MDTITNLGIIPARYGSTRFPGKPLAKIGGIPMIERVYNQALKSNLDHVTVATDDEKILHCVEQFGGHAIMTHSDLLTGTARCIEALKMSGLHPKNTINIQGDEPFIDPQQINRVLQLLSRPEVDIATVVSPALTLEEVESTHRVKVVLSNDGKALYFSRLPIPFSPDNRKRLKDYFIHLGIYGFKTTVMLALEKLSTGYLERAESLEQLTWLENGYAIYTVSTLERTDSVDTPEDLESIEKKLFG